MNAPDAARERLAAIEALRENLQGYLTQAEKLLYEGLIARLEQTYTQPELLPSLLAEFTQLVHLPLLTYYGQSLLTLPALQERYFKVLDGSVDYAVLRAPLRGFLEQTFGITAEGTPVAGGYLSTFLNDTGANRALLHYAYQSQAAGIGLDQYRAGLEDLVLGGANGGLLSKLHKEAGDNFSQADRALQVLASEELGLTAFLYQGGLVEGSRPFCKVRNGKVFLKEEVAKFGTSKDAFGGYSDKKAGMFNGKVEPYNPFTDCGGARCRHGLHGLPNLVAMKLRPELKEDAQGKLVLP